MILRRILGALILLIALLGVALSAAGTVYSHRIIDGMGRNLDTSLDLASHSLYTARDTLLLAKTALGQVNDGLETIESTAMDISQTISQTRPLLSEMAQIVSHDVPDGVEAFQGRLLNPSGHRVPLDFGLARLGLRADQPRHVMPGVGEPGGQGRPDEPACPADQDSHRPSLSMSRRRLQMFGRGVLIAKLKHEIAQGLDAFDRHGVVDRRPTAAHGTMTLQLA